jgi:hypothetical protein
LAACGARAAASEFHIPLERQNRISVRKLGKKE